MATTNSNFVKLANAALIGSTVQAAGQVVAVNHATATQIINGGTGTYLDRFNVDLATAGYAKNGSAAATLTGTTAVTYDLTDLTSTTSGTTAWAGDTTFATWNQLVFRNTGAADITVAQGASNGARLGLTGTTPAFTVPAGSVITFQSIAGYTVDSTHKVITITPTAGGSFALSVGGA